MIPENVKQVMIDLHTEQGVMNRMPAIEAESRAVTHANAADKLLRDALGRLNLTVSYHPEGTRIIALASDTPPAEGWEQVSTEDLEALRQANPEGDLHMSQEDYEAMTADGDTVPCKRVHEGSDFDWCLSAHLSMLKNAMRYGHVKLYPGVPFPEVLAKEAFEQYEPQPAHQPVEDMPEPGIAGPGRPDRQELEDRLHILADIIDRQPSFGTDLANFKRRLQRVIG